MNLRVPRTLNRPTPGIATKKKNYIHYFHPFFQLLESKSTSDGEQADSWGSHKKYTRYYGSGDGTQSDDEDEDDYDGSGSGREGSGGYYPARPGRRGKQELVDFNIVWGVCE